jgi:hypothetical protein
MKALLALATAATAIALAVPAALAAPQQPGYSFITDTLGGDGHASQGYSFITDTLAPGGGAAPQRGAPQGYSFITDTLAPGGGPAQRVVTVSVSSGFSWVDAAVGAGAAGGALLALLGASLLVLRRQGRPAI